MAAARAAAKEWERANQEWHEALDRGDGAAKNTLLAIWPPSRRKHMCRDYGTFQL